MKRVLIFILFIVCLSDTKAQFVHKIKADSVLITNDSCTAELNLENSTKGIKGFLYNKGNGRTEFRKVVPLNDSVIVLGEDTITIIGVFDNGLTRNGKNVKLGGTLIQPTIISQSSATNHLTVTGPGTTIGTGVLNVDNPGGGTAIGITSNFGIGVYTRNTLTGIWSDGPGPGITANANLNTAGTFRSTNSRVSTFWNLNNSSSLQEVIGIIRTTVNTTPANGIGSMISFYTQTNGTTGTNGRVSTQLESSWVNAGDSVRSALFGITLPQPGTNARSEIAKFFSPGNIQFPRYAGNTFNVSDSGAYKPIVMDASGNIMKFDSWAVSGSGGSGGMSDAPTFNPAHFSINNFTDSSLFNTSMGCTFSGGKIVVTSGTTNFSNWLSFKDTVCSNHWRIVARCSNTSVKSGNTFGFSLGMRSVNSFSLNSMAVFPNTSNNANSGRFEFFAQANGNSFTSLLTHNTAVANAQNDKLILVMERNNSKLYLSLFNETTKLASTETTLTIHPSDAPTIMPNTAVPTIWFHSTAGTVMVDSFYFQDLEAKKADILFLGDSKTSGFGAGLNTDTYPSLLGKVFPSYATCAGFGDRTTDIRARLAQVIALKPKVVIAAFGCNDVRAGTWNTASKNNYEYIDSTLMGNGIYVLHCLPFKESSLDLTAQKDWIASHSRFAGRIIDTWTPTQEAGLLHTDGIHLNNKGYAKIAAAIKTSPLILNRGIRVEHANE